MARAYPMIFPVCKIVLCAQMAELVDALASGASVRMDVEVQVLFWAPISGFMLA